MLHGHRLLFRCGLHAGVRGGLEYLGMCILDLGVDGLDPGQGDISGTDGSSSALVFAAAVAAGAAAVLAAAAALSAIADALSAEAAALNADVAALSAQAAALGGGGRGHRTGLHEAFPWPHLCKKGVREWGLGFMYLGVAGTGADEPTKLKEGDLNRHRYFHRKRFLENNCV